MSNSENPKWIEKRDRRAAFEHLDKLMKDAQRKIRNNKHELSRIAKEQGQLKNDLSALHQLRTEFLK